MQLRTLLQLGLGQCQNIYLDHLNHSSAKSTVCLVWCFSYQSPRSVICGCWKWRGWFGGLTGPKFSQVPWDRKSTGSNPPCWVIFDDEMCWEYWTTALPTTCVLDVGSASFRGQPLNPCLSQKNLDHLPVITRTAVEQNASGTSAMKLSSTRRSIVWWGSARGHP